jgi:hypothetical protein
VWVNHVAAAVKYQGMAHAARAAATPREREEAQNVLKPRQSTTTMGILLLAMAAATAPTTAATATATLATPAKEQISEILVVFGSPAPCAHAHSNTTCCKVSKTP